MYLILFGIYFVTVRQSRVSTRKQRSGLFLIVLCPRPKRESLLLQSNKLSAAAYGVPDPVFYLFFIPTVSANFFLSLYMFEIRYIPKYILCF